MTVNLAELDMPNIPLHDLEVPFSEEEVWKTVKALPPDKAPGPMGLQADSIKCVGRLSKWT